MKKRIQKHIDKQEYVKVYLCDEDDSTLTHFNGFILEQDEKHVLMCTNNDFFYDGITVFKKADIEEIRRTDNEKFFQKILEKEGLKKEFMEKSLRLKFHLDTYPKMFQFIQKMKIPIVLEAIYGKDERFQIGPVKECDQKKVKINYFNSRGEYDLKFVSCKYKEITHFTLDSPYATIFYKYVKEVE